MKIRNGFVSNSSSSSFIVTFPCVPQSIEETQNILSLPDQVEAYGHFVASSTVAEVVYLDLRRQEIFKSKKHDYDKKRLWREIYSSNWQCSSYPAREKEESDLSYEARYEKWDKWRDQLAHKTIDNLLEDASGQPIYIFNYEDNSELGNVLEHGDIFRNLPHIVLDLH